MNGIEELRELPVSERLQLVEELWDSIAVEPSTIRLSKSQMEELDRRIERSETTPGEGVEWGALRERILQNL